MSNKNIEAQNSNTEVSGTGKKIKHGSMSLVIIALVAAIVVLINIMAGYMEKRTPLKLDLTADNRYELSDESINFLKNDLDQDVDIIVTCPKETFSQIEVDVEAYYRRNFGIDVDLPYSMIPIILEKYQLYANQGKGKINVKYVDLQNDPKALAKYEGNYDGSFTDRSIVVASGDRVRVINTDSVGSMIARDSSLTNQVAFVFAGESVITSEIMNVTDAHPVNVAIAATINGESVYDQSISGNYATYTGLRDELLSKNGYFCKEIDLLTDDLDPDDYDMLIIPMPKQDFDEKIIDKISDFLYNNENYGKNVLYIADVAQSGLKNIDEFLRDWSIEISPKILIDQENYMGTDPRLIYVELSDSEEFEDIQLNSKLPAVAYMPCPVNVVAKNSDTKAVPMIESYDTARALDVTDENDQGTKGKYNVGVLAYRLYQSKENQFETVQSNVLAIGGGFMTASDYLVQTKLYKNSGLLLGILNKMTGKDTAVVIPEKSLQQATIAPTADQAKRIKLVVVYVIPAVIAAIGLFVLLRRRNR